VVYRWLGDQADDEGQNPVSLLSRTCDRLVASLQACGVNPRRLTGRDFYAWLLPWFNPAPPSPANHQPRSIDACPTRRPMTARAVAAVRPRLRRAAVLQEPRSDSEQGLWYFDQQPHAVMVVDKLRRPPHIGQLTGETRKGRRSTPCSTSCPSRR
jgi:hypothetical protein